jgi:RNA polymerase sigma factor for flagellar operon FliA
MSTVSRKSAVEQNSAAGTKSEAPATDPAAATERKSNGRSDKHSQQLWVQFKRDMSNQDLRNQLMEHYLPLVRYSAERLWARLPDGVELDDLISAGIFGLMDAITAFDLERGVKFETYCSTRVRGAMLDELRNMDWVPRLVRSKASKLNQVTSRLVMKLGRQPSEQELSREMDLSLPELEKMVFDANAISLVSLDKRKWRDDGYKDIREIDVVENKRSVNPTKREQKKDLIRLVTKGLNRNERLIVILYYYEEMTMKEIGTTLSLSESRVSQMHSSIVRRLQNQLDHRRTEFAA